MQVESKLAIIIDPPNQDPALASARIDEFIQKGGRGVLVGGSGAIESNIFQDTIAGIIDITRQYPSIPVWILPGHIDQVLETVQGVTGVMNYKYIFRK